VRSARPSLISPPPAPLPIRPLAGGSLLAAARPAAKEISSPADNEVHGAKTRFQAKSPSTEVLPGGKAQLNEERVRGNRLLLRLFASGCDVYAYVNGNPLTYVDPDGLDRQATGPAMVYTFRDERRTVFFDPVSGEYKEIETRNDVSSRSKPGAGGPYHNVIKYCEIRDFDPAYGTVKIYTGDPRSRWIHGGGSDPNVVDDPWAPQQGWQVTRGCTRGQNEDVEDVCKRIKKWMQDNPKKQIPYGRY
jgi:hypothetical protein